MAKRSALNTAEVLPALHLNLLGGVEVFWQEQSLPVSAPRMLALLAYLHLQGAASRPELEMMFWPGQGANAVRQGLYTLRRLPGAQHWLRQEGQQVTLHADSDVQEMQTALQAGQDERALDLLSAGPLLGHLSVTGSVEFSDWLEDRRGELLEARRAVLRREAARYARLENWAQARTHLHTLLTLDPLDEHTYRDLMRLEGQSGNPDAALDVFETLRRTLHTELQSEPEPETLALLHELEGHDISGQNRARLLTPEGLSTLELDTLHGRQEEQVEVLARLQDKRRALVQGMAGMGKTRLAWSVAEHHLQAGQNVLWLELGGDPPEVLLSALSEPLGLKQVPPRTQPRPLHAALHDKQISLIVLDNAANSYALSVLLEYLPPDRPVLVTSRLRLPRLTTLTLHRLPRQDALNLITDHLEGQTTDPDSLNALCALLGDHPYALRLAAITLQQGGRTPRELLQTLTDAPHALGAEHSIKALLAHSTAALDAESYEAYLGLGSLFTPQTTPELLALALRRDPDNVERALYTLTQHGLTTREAQQGRDTVTFRMHELTWHDARAHASLQPRTVVQAVRQYAHANTGTPDNLYAELPNLIAGAQHAEKHAPDELVQIMTGWLGGRYIAAQGFPLGYVSLLERSIERVEFQQNWSQSGFLTAKLGDIHQFILGDREKSIALYLKSAHYAALSQDFAQAAGRLSLAGSLQAIIGLPENQQTLLKAWELALQSQDDLCLFKVLEQQGIAHCMHSEFNQACAKFEEARTLMERLLSSATQDQSELSMRHIIFLSNYGQVKLEMQEPEEALHLRSAALNLARQRGDPLLTGLRLLDYGEVLAALRHEEEARQSYQEATIIFRRLGAKGQEVTAQKMLSMLGTTL